MQTSFDMSNRSDTANHRAIIAAEKIAECDPVTEGWLIEYWEAERIAQLAIAANLSTGMGC